MRMSQGEQTTRMMQVGVVSGAGEVLWIGAARTRAALAEEIADFLIPRADYQLHDGDRTQFRRLLAQSQPQRAVDLYFATVGSRWDVERLSVVTRRVPVSGEVSGELQLADSGVAKRA